MKINYISCHYESTNSTNHYKCTSPRQQDCIAKRLSYVIEKICTSITHGRFGRFYHGHVTIAKDSYVDSELEAIHNTLDRLVVDVLFSHRY